MTNKVLINNGTYLNVKDGVPMNKAITPNDLEPEVPSLGTIYFHFPQVQESDEISPEFKEYLNRLYSRIEFKISTDNGSYSKNFYGVLEKLEIPDYNQTSVRIEGSLPARIKDVIYPHPSLPEEYTNFGLRFDPITMSSTMDKTFPYGGDIHIKIYPWFNSNESVDPNGSVYAGEGEYVIICGFYNVEAWASEEAPVWSREYVQFAGGLESYDENYIEILIVPQRCPPGLAFNPLLIVCDYPPS